MPGARGPRPTAATPGAAPALEGRGPRPSVQEALLRVYPLPFADETTLEEVAAHFRTSWARRWSWTWPRWTART
jgi:hypothetical protein